MSFHKPGGAADAEQYIPVTPVSTTDAVDGVTFWSADVTPGTYMIFGLGVVVSASSTNGVQVAVDGTATRTSVALTTDVPTGPTASQYGSVYDTMGGVVFTAVTNGPTSNRPAMICAEVVVTTSGTLTMRVRSEAVGVQVSVVAGTMVLTKMA